MISPDKAGMHRFEPATPPAGRPATPGGRMTVEILNTLVKPDITKRDSRVKQNEKKKEAGDILEGVKAMAHMANQKERGAPEITATDMIHELVIHELQKALFHAGHTNVDEAVVKGYVMDMLPEGEKEGKRFFKTIDAFKTALASGNFELVNAIYRDPERYPGRGLTYWVEHFDRDKRPKMNQHLLFYLRSALERRIADVLSVGDIANFVAIFDGVDFIDKLTLANIPLNPVVITGDPLLRADILAVLQAQHDGGRRPKCTEAKALGLVPPGQIPTHLALSESAYAAQHGSVPFETERKTFEQTASQLSEVGGPLPAGYKQAVEAPDVMSEMRTELLDTFHGPANIEELHPTFWGHETRLRPHKTAQEHITDVLKFDQDVLVKVFEPYAGMPDAVKAAVVTAKNELRAALKDRDKTPTPPHPRTHAPRTRADIIAEIGMIRGELNLRCLPYRRMKPQEFEQFRRDVIRPDALTNVLDVLGRYQDLAQFTLLKNEYTRLREDTYVPYSILTQSDIDDRAFRDSQLQPVVRTRLNNAAAVRDGGVSLALERRNLLAAGVINSHDVVAWGI